VLDPLHGYLLLAAKLVEDGPRYAGAWNFGPEPGEIVEVETVAREIGRAWGKNGPDFTWDKQPDGPHEASILRLDSTKARTLLGWRPRLGLRDTVQMTVDWYRAFGQGKTALREISEEQIARYLNVQSPTTISKSQAG
jgi:CDP-glucose 4,6-dehydratase